MLLKYFYDTALAHASYLVGCQRTGEAIIVDPGRDIEQYLEAAAKEDAEKAAARAATDPTDNATAPPVLGDKVGGKKQRSRKSNQSTARIV